MLCVNVFASVFGALAIVFSACVSVLSIVTMMVVVVIVVIVIAVVVIVVVVVVVVIAKLFFATITCH